MEDYTVKSVDKALLLLEVISDYPRGVAITELSSRTGMYKSTIHRLLGTLMKRGFVEQDGQSGRYKLGYTLLDLGMRLLASIDLRSEALPHLQELARQANEVVHLALLDQGEVVYIEKVETPQTIRMHSRVGKRVPVHATGLGKAILAFLPIEEVQALIRRYGLPKLTEFTVTDEQTLLESLERIRQLGYAIDVEEHELGICCVAAPIFDNAGQVVAACSVSGPRQRLDPARLQELSPVVVQTGRRISERLGHLASTRRSPISSMTDES
ncbi:MAG: IclR family transcriptional regulator [Alicyclobacillus herbarius]|uniref:IclR family transcriptional regulator n=1 Tax=Alicyclobacillus herbarius TaxID=122960 RepID=UPI002354E5BB|nr:IclR family transcriptional regulator [Alicyclobacillus herbarius]MCL6632264.1 IclR family transcriptional regulator [Alicyclobacillus herbarius]